MTFDLTHTARQPVGILVDLPMLILANEDIKIAGHSIFLHYSLIMNRHMHVRTTLIVFELLSFLRYAAWLIAQMFSIFYPRQNPNIWFNGRALFTTVISSALSFNSSVMSSDVLLAANAKTRVMNSVAAFPSKMPRNIWWLFFISPVIHYERFEEKKTCIPGVSPCHEVDQSGLVAWKVFHFEHELWGVRAWTLSEWSQTAKPKEVLPPEISNSKSDYSSS